MHIYIVKVDFMAIGMYKSITNNYWGDLILICKNKSLSSGNLYETIKSLLWEARAKPNFSTNFYTVQAYWNLV